MNTIDLNKPIVEIIEQRLEVKRLIIDIVLNLFQNSKCYKS